MPINLSNPAEKQTVLVIVGVVVAVVLLLILGNFYGRFLKTQVAPGSTYSATGNLKTDTLEPGVYTLKFTGRDATSSVDASTTFEITASSTPVPNGSPTPAPISTPTPTPASPY